VALNSPGRSSRERSRICNNSTRSSQGGGLGDNQATQRLSFAPGDLRGDASSIYAYLSESDKELYDVTGMLPAPGGRPGQSDRVGTAEWFLFKPTPTRRAKGTSYSMEPENLRNVMRRGRGVGGAYRHLAALTGKPGFPVWGVYAVRRPPTPSPFFHDNP